jgi:hypothetical protein
MAGDGELNAHKRQPGDIPVVDKLLAAGAVLHAQTKRHRSSVSFRWTWSPAFGRHPESLESADHLGELAASYPRAQSAWMVSGFRRPKTLYGALEVKQRIHGMLFFPSTQFLCSTWKPIS